MPAIKKKNHLQCRRCGFDHWVRKILCNREWQPPPGFLPGKSHGQRSLTGYSPWRRKESEMTVQLTLNTSDPRHGFRHELFMTFLMTFKDMQWMMYQIMSFLLLPFIYWSSLRITVLDDTHLWKWTNWIEPSFLEDSDIHQSLLSCH